MSLFDRRSHGQAVSYVAEECFGVIKLVMYVVAQLHALIYCEEGQRRDFHANDIAASFLGISFHITPF